jgi:hypothetical protein
MAGVLFVPYQIDLFHLYINYFVAGISEVGNNNDGKGSMYHNDN